MDRSFNKKRRLLAVGTPLSATALALTGALAPVSAWAREYPSRTISVVVAQAAGGGSDTITRMWAEYVSKLVGQPIVVVNKPGAGGAIAAQDVLSKPADGYTLYSAGTSSLVLSNFTYKQLPYDPAKDFQGVSLLVGIPYLLVTNPRSGIASLDDLKRLASEKPEGLNFGSAGYGNATHLIAELLQSSLGIKMTHVPYKGETAALTALMSDEIQILVSVVSTALPHVTNGRVVPLVVFGRDPVPELPAVKTASALGLEGFSDIVWAVIVGRSGLPQAVVQKLHAATQRFLADPEVKARLQGMRFEPLPSGLDEYDRRFSADMKRWAEETRTMDLSPQ